jgi:hypothetical protein
MRSTNTTVKNAIRAHILAAVYDVAGNPFETVRDAATWLAVEFDRVADHPHNVRRFPNHADRFHDYLMGLPFDFEYTHAGIDDTLTAWGLNPEGKTYPPEKAARTYTALIFREMNACKG